MIDEYEAIGGMRIGGEKRSTRRKPAPVPLCPPQIQHDLGSNPGRRGGKPATNRLKYGTALQTEEDAVTRSGYLRMLLQLQILLSYEGEYDLDFIVFSWLRLHRLTRTTSGRHIYCYCLDRARSRLQHTLLVFAGGGGLVKNI
jgi:hypothetical protein